MGKAEPLGHCFSHTKISHTLSPQNAPPSPSALPLHVGKGVFLGSQLLALFAVRHENVATVFGERV